MKVDKLKEKNTPHPNRNLKYQSIKWNRSETDDLSINIEIQGINEVRKRKFSLRRSLSSSDIGKVP